MTNSGTAATVCGKCGCAIWVRCTIDILFPPRDPKPIWADAENQWLRCSTCGNELDRAHRDSLTFESCYAGTLKWNLPNEDRTGWQSFAATHLVCIRCKKEDRSTGYDYETSQANAWLPHWAVSSYYGITSWGAKGGEPWNDDLHFCADCVSRPDTDNWIVQTFGLILLKHGQATQHLFSQAANEVRAQFPNFELMPPPWG